MTRFKEDRGEKCCPQDFSFLGWSLVSADADYISPKRVHNFKIRNNMVAFDVLLPFEFGI